ncbi:MAG: tripartite tricarboxylate transporter substrate binding protein [Luteibacter sp.]
MSSSALAVQATARLHAGTVSGPTTLLIGFPPGGPTDGVGRVIAEPLRDQLGAPVVVVNRPGAAGRIAVSAAARATPNGHTLLLTPGAMVTIHPHLYPELPKDPWTWLAPIALIGTTNLSIVVAADHPARSLGELLRLFQRSPDTAHCGTPGSGTVAHLALVDMAGRTGTPFTPVHYRGAPDIVNAVIGGSLQSGAVIPGVAMPFAAAGKIRILATSGAERAQMLPDVPTWREAGVDIVVQEWVGLFAPAGTPPQRVRELGDDVLEAIARPAVNASFERYGLLPGHAGPRDFAGVIRQDYAHWGRIIERNGIKAET